MCSLTGTINTKDGEFYTHLHMCAADADAHVYGGHLVDATISATCEMVIRVLDGTVDRQFNEEVGLNLFKF
jgi:predicted DNA-binding protein with PD1-like motif